MFFLFLAGVYFFLQFFQKFAFALPESDFSWWFLERILFLHLKDCFVLFLGTIKELNKAVDIIINRIKYVFKGVPPETRKALDNGNTEFLRELHGGARLYPDTDSQAIMNTAEEVKQIQNILPNYPWEIIEDYAKKFKIEKSSIKKLIFKGKLFLFDNLIDIYPEFQNRLKNIF